MPSLLPIVLLTAAVAGHAPVSHARQPQASRTRSTSAPTQAPAERAGDRSPRASPSGWIEGVVTDDRNQPVLGAAVTAQGRDLLIIETDRVGRFELRSIPAGTYLLRVQGRGFAASRREFVQVVPSRGTHFDVQLRRAAAPVMAPGDRRACWRPASACRRPPADAVDGVLPAARRRSSRPSAPRRCRTITRRRRGACGTPSARCCARPRSRIDDVSQLDDEDLWRSIARLDDVAGWTLGVGRSAASALLNGALTGRVQLLTAGAFDQPFEALHDRRHAGGHRLRPPRRAAQHAHELERRGRDRARRRHLVVRRRHLRHRRRRLRTASRCTARTAGSARRRPAASASCGLEDDAPQRRRRRRSSIAGRISPRAHARRTADATSTTTTCAIPACSARRSRHRCRRRIGPGSASPRRSEMSAPGAEEFVPQAYGSLSLPPQRTFSPLVAGAPLEAPGDAASRRRARAGHRHASASALTHFRQHVDGQLATVFDPSLAKGQRRADLSHYGVASVGNFAGQRLGRRRQPPGRHAPARRPRIPDVGRRRGRSATPSPRSVWSRRRRCGPARADARRDAARGRGGAAHRHALSGRLPLQLAASRAARSTRTRRPGRPATTSRSIRACRS